MIFQRKYATLLVAATRIHIPVIKRGVVDFALTANWTPVAGDVTVVKDGNAMGNITNLPAPIDLNGGLQTVWAFTLTATELTCKQLTVMIVDAATKAVEDQSFNVETFGHASAYYPSDFGADNTDAEARFLSAVKGNVLGTVGSGSTPTSIVTSALDPPATIQDQFKARIMTFAKDTTTINLRGQGTDITGSSSGGVLTVTALTTAPVSGDTFTIT